MGSLTIHKIEQFIRFILRFSYFFFLQEGVIKVGTWEKCALKQRFFPGLVTDAKIVGIFISRITNVCVS